MAGRYTTKALILVATVTDLSLNAAYATFSVVPVPGALLTDPRARFLSLTVANGLFLGAYAVLSFLLARHGRIPKWLTLAGLPAWASALGLCLNGVGLFTGLNFIFGAVFTIAFLVWLLGLLVVDASKTQAA